MLVLALSLTAFHVKSKTRSSSSPPLSLFVKIRFLFLTLLLSGFKVKFNISNEEPRKRERPHDPKRQKDLARLYV